MDKSVVINELQRVASLLDAKHVSRSAFARHGNLSTAVVEATFGSWNEAIAAAGLIPLPQGGFPKSEERRLERLHYAGTHEIGDISDELLLEDLVRLANKLGRRPSGNQIAAKGKYGRDIYQRRWKSVSAAYEAAINAGMVKGD